MRWLIARAATISLVLIALVSVAVFIGRQQPPPRAITMLHLNDCELPCWIGITPGKTTLVEARARIGEMFGSDPRYTLSNSRADSVTAFNQAGDPLFNVILSIDGQHVDRPITGLWVAVFSPEVQLTVGDMFILLGNPTSVNTPFSSPDYGDRIDAFFEKSQADVLTARNTCDILRPNQKVLGIMIHAPDQMVDIENTSMTRLIHDGQNGTSAWTLEFFNQTPHLAKVHAPDTHED